MATVHAERSIPNGPSVPNMHNTPNTPNMPCIPTMPRTAEPTIASLAGHAEPSHLLRHNRAFQILVAGQAVSLVGRGTATWALPLLALIMFHQPAIFGIVTAAAWVPSLFAPMPAGVLADHVSRKALMIICDTLRTLLLASVVVALLLGDLTVVHLVAVAVAEGTLAETFTVALAAALPEIVGTDPRTYGRANALTANLDNLGQLLGPTIGGLLAPLAWLLPFAETALTFAVSAGSLVFVRRPFSAIRSAAATQLQESGGWRHELVEGIVWLWRHPTLRMVAWFSGLANMVMIGLPALLTLYGYTQGFSAFQIGLVVTCCGLGALLGALITAPVVAWWGFGPVYIGFSLAQAVQWPLLLLTHTVPSVCAIAALAGAIDQVISVAQKTYRGLVIPDALRARVQGVFRAAVYGAGVLGLLAQGIAAQQFGVASVVWAGTLVLAFGAIWSLFVRSVRHAPFPLPMSVDRPIVWAPAAWTRRYSTYGATRVFQPDVPSTADLPNTPSMPSMPGTPWGMPGVVVFPAE